MADTKIALKAAQVNKSLNLVEAAKRLGINKDCLIRHENGKTHPDGPTIQKMEKLYGISFNQINFLCP